MLDVTENQNLVEFSIDGEENLYILDLANRLVFNGWDLSQPLDKDFDVVLSLIQELSSELGLNSIT